ncbi:DgyrCDS557, partial [Dimorphilus gyrociliatus]
MSTEELKRIACKAIDDNAAKLNGVSQEIWSKPELAFEEVEAHKLLTEFLTDQGFENVEKSFLMKTGFRARAGNPDHQRHVAILCEYDALPEIGHACGHNLIAEAGVGAAIGVLAAIKAGARGRVSVFGTPAEEGGGGKLPFIEKGLFNDVDAAMMVHPCFFDSFKHEFLSIKRIQATFHGKASHAAASPWEGINALDAAVTAYTSISALRQQMHPKWKVHGIISDGGVKPNIIPERSQIEYYLRTPTEVEMKTLEMKIRNCIEGAALTANCTVEIKQLQPSYKNMVFNDVLVNLFSENAKELGLIGEEFDPSKPTGSTDMGNVSHVVPSIHPMYAIPTKAFNHTREFTDDAGKEYSQAPTILQAKAMAMTAIDLFENPKLLPTIREDFENYLHQVKQKRGWGFTPNFDYLIKEGTFVEGGLLGSYATVTIPSHWTIATGMYQESHGVVGRQMYDPRINETLTITADSSKSSFWFNNGTSGGGGEPIWVTNERQGGLSGVMHWIGLDVELHGFLPTRQEKFNIDMATGHKETIDKLINWLIDENPINLGLLYISQPDKFGHFYGPTSIEVLNEIIRLDDIVGYLIERLKEEDLYDSINLIITSDHGMTDSSKEKLIVLEDYLDSMKYVSINNSPIIHITPLEGVEADEIIKNLSSVKHIKVWKKEDIPSEFHYKFNERIMPILLTADLNWNIVKTRREYNKWCKFTIFYRKNIRSSLLFIYFL